jgi:hypothetical protein
MLQVIYVTLNLFQGLKGMAKNFSITEGERFR